MLTKPTMETQQRKSMLRVWLAREDQEYQKVLTVAGIPKPALLRIAGETFEEKLRETALTLATDRIEAPDLSATLLTKADFAQLCEDLWLRLRMLNVQCESPEMRRGLEYAVESVMRRTLPRNDSAPTLLMIHEKLLANAKTVGGQAVLTAITDEVRDDIIRFTELPSAFFARFTAEAVAAARVAPESPWPQGDPLTPAQRDALDAHLRAEAQRIWRL